MAQEIINVGALPNDGEGDPLRVAFQKVNNNFANLFATGYSTAEATTVGLTPDQVIFEYDVNLFTQGTLIVRSYDPTVPDMQNITLSAAITNNLAGVKFSAYGTTFDGNAVCGVDMDVFDGNVRVLVNPIQDTVIYHYIVYQITATDLVMGVGLGLPGLGANAVMATEGNVVISTEG